MSVCDPLPATLALKKEIPSIPFPDHRPPLRDGSFVRSINPALSQTIRSIPASTTRSSLTVIVLVSVLMHPSPSSYL